MTLQFGALLTDDASSVNYDHNMFIIQATDRQECDRGLETILVVKTEPVLKDKRETFVEKFWRQKNTSALSSFSLDTFCQKKHFCTKNALVKC